MRSVGFDLDMTLVDSANSIATSLQHVMAQYGVEADGGELRATIGLPLDLVFPRWLPDEPYDVLLAAYREHYIEHGIPLTRPMPGAAEAIASVRERGDRVLIVTAKYGVSARLALQAAGLVADEVVGDLFAEDKASALLEHDAWVYVGDHPGDVRAARTAGVHAVVVATGPTSVEALHAAGPDVVLPDLTHLPAWLASA